ncbi:MAG TPA: hypothetical protein VKC33_06475 [Burkholderiales bacterium]|nr:hypothetical protein [Burkholderiales bacterium]
MELDVRAILAAFLLGTSSAYADDTDVLRLIPQLLAKNERLEDHGFKVTRTKTQWVVSYCPDNTCDIFRTPLQTPRKVVGDFALLWLYFSSGYIYLESFETDAQALVESTVERYSKECPPTTEEATASCVLIALAARYNIRLAFRRYDEGGVVESKLEPTKKLSPDRIRDAKWWQRNEWEKSKEPWELNR